MVGLLDLKIQNCTILKTFNNFTLQNPEINMDYSSLRLSIIIRPADLFYSHEK